MNKYIDLNWTPSDDDESSQQTTVEYQSSLEDSSDSDGSRKRKRKQSDLEELLHCDETIPTSFKDYLNGKYSGWSLDGPEVCLDRHIEAIELIGLLNTQNTRLVEALVSLQERVEDLQAFRQFVIKTFVAYDLVEEHICPSCKRTKQNK